VIKLLAELAGAVHPLDVLDHVDDLVVQSARQEQQVVQLLLGCAISLKLLDRNFNTSDLLSDVTDCKIIVFHRADRIETIKSISKLSTQIST
jgi:hypothetical protein